MLTKINRAGKFSSLQLPKASADSANEQDHQHRASLACILWLIKLHPTPAHSSPLVLNTRYSKKWLPADICQVGTHRYKGHLCSPVQFSLFQCRVNQTNLKMSGFSASTVYAECYLTKFTVYSSIPLYSQGWICLFLSLWINSLCLSSVPIAVLEGKWSSLLDVVCTPHLIPRGRGCDFPISNLPLTHHICEGCILPGRLTSCTGKKQDQW